MIEKLEEIKKVGAYAVNVTFGEDIGCDDSDVPTNERKIVCVYTPVGCLGERRVMWRGTYEDFLKFDFSSIPKIISNPPKREEYKEPGFYTWGTENSTREIAQKSCNFANPN